MFADEGVPKGALEVSQELMARMSSDKECENHARRKSKGSWAR